MNSKFWSESTDLDLERGGLDPITGFCDHHKPGPVAFNPVVVISVFRNLTFERWVVCVAVLCYIVDHWCLIYYFQSDEHSRKDYIKIWFVRMMLEFDVEKLITVVEQLLCNFTYKWMYSFWR